MKNYSGKEKLRKRFRDSAGCILYQHVSFYHEFRFAQAEDKAAIACYKETAKTVVHSTAAGLEEILKSVKSEKERVDMIRSFIKPYTFLF